jgi:sporulation protein YlmC with PRC-barrel domain
MKSAIYALIALLLLVTTPYAQQVRGKTEAPQTATPMPDIDKTTLAASVRVSELMGSMVYNGGMPIGQIEDVLIQLDHASITVLVLSVGEFLGVGNKLVAVSADEIKISSEAKFTTVLTPEQLTNAPAFDFGQLKD